MSGFINDNCDCVSPILLYRGFGCNDTPIQHCNFTSPLVHCNAGVPLYYFWKFNNDERLAVLQSSWLTLSVRIASVKASCADSLYIGKSSILDVTNLFIRCLWGKSAWRAQQTSAQEVTRRSAVVSSCPWVGLYYTLDSNISLTLELKWTFYFFCQIPIPIPCTALPASTPGETVYNYVPRTVASLVWSPPHPSSVQTLALLSVERNHNLCTAVTFLALKAVCTRVEPFYSIQEKEFS